MKSAKLHSNIWLKRGASALGLLYAIFICILSYHAVFYEIIITQRLAFCLLLTVISIVAGAAMIYSRKQLMTKISGFIMFPALLPVVLLCFGSWEMIIPLAVCAIVIFFASGSNEAAKTLLGTIYLLTYILAALAYFIFTSFLASPAIKETIESGVSPSGKYRYEVIETTDSSNGSTSVILEPNFLDKKYALVTFKVKGYDRKLCVKRPKTEVELEWKDDDLYINGERWFTPEQAKRGKWFEKESRSFDFM